MKYMLEKMTWEEAGEALETEKMVLFPVGSIEQHGPHCPLGIDFWTAQELARRVGELTQIPTLPTIPMGYAQYHSDFPGTLSVSKPTYEQFLYEVCSQIVKWGVTHILFVSGHGGDRVPCEDVGMRLRKDGVLVGVVEWWHIGGYLNKEWALIGHGDKHETSAAMYLHPDSVRLDRAKPSVHKKLSEEINVDLGTSHFRGAPVNIVLHVKDVCENGALLEAGVFPDIDYTVSPAEATEKHGKEMFEVLSEYIADFARSFRKLNIKK
jgi:creatinine amidohydrolase